MQKEIVSLGKSIAVIVVGVLIANYVQTKFLVKSPTIAPKA